MRYPIRYPITAALALLAGGAALAAAIDERAEAPLDGEVEIANVAGSVDVRAWDRAEISVTGELGDSARRLEFRRKGDYTEIRVINPSNGRVDPSRLEIRLPEDSRVSVTTVSAKITVEGLRGPQSLQSVSGDVETESWAGEVRLKTVSGDIRLRGHGEPGAVTVTTVSGDANIDDVAGEVNASTVSGDIDLEGGTLNRVRATATNGDLDLEFALAPDGRLEAETVNGDVDVRFAEPFDADVDVETLNGDIENCFGQDAVRKSRYGPGNELRFTRGEGMARVRIETLNGDVDLCTR